MSAYFTLFWELSLAWFNADRIRTSPVTGRLLSLQPGDRFVIDDQTYLVLQRDVKQNAKGFDLTYQLEQSDKVCLLNVFYAQGQVANSGNLISEFQVREVFDDDIALCRRTDADRETALLLAKRYCRLDKAE